MAEIFARLGPAQVEGKTPNENRLEWFFDDSSGVEITFRDPCEKPAVLRLELANSQRRQELKERAGLWAVLKSGDATQAGARERDPSADSLAFYYDGETFTQFMIDGPLMVGQPCDNVYRMETKWIGEDLYVLLPYAQEWVKEMAFRDGRFERAGVAPDQVLVYGRFGPGELPGGAVLTQQRPVWNLTRETARPRPCP